MVQAIGVGEGGGRRDDRLGVEAGPGHQPAARAIAASMASAGFGFAGP